MVCSIQSEHERYGLDTIERRTQGTLEMEPQGHISQRFETTEKLSYKRHISDTTEEEQNSQKVFPNDSIQAWQDFHLLLGDPWWARVWIFQEYMLASKIIFLARGRSFQAEDFIATFEKMYERRANLRTLVAEYRQKPANVQVQSTARLGANSAKRPTDNNSDEQSICITREVDSLDRIAEDPAWQNVAFLIQQKSKIMATFNEQPIIPLSKLLDHARNCNCTDPRDRVYAFLAFVDPECRIRVDYSASNTWSDVSADAVTKMIQKEQDLNIIMLAMEATDFNPLVNKFPTWVRNYAVRDIANSDYKLFLTGIGPHLVTCETAMESSLEVSFGPDEHGRPNRELSALGSQIDTLSTPTPPDDNPHWKWFQSQTSAQVYGVPVTVMRNDEIWVLRGLKYPIVVSKRKRGYVLRGHAAIKNGKAVPLRSQLDVRMTLI
jgi:hypothetical protein